MTCSRTSGSGSSRSRAIASTQIGGSALERATTLASLGHHCSSVRAAWIWSRSSGLCRSPSAQIAWPRTSGSPSSRAARHSSASLALSRAETRQVAPHTVDGTRALLRLARQAASRRSPSTSPCLAGPAGVVEAGARGSRGGFTRAGPSNEVSSRCRGLRRCQVAATVHGTRALLRLAVAASRSPSTSPCLAGPRRRRGWTRISRVLAPALHRAAVPGHAFLRRGLWPQGLRVGVACLEVRTERRGVLQQRIRDGDVLLARGPRGIGPVDGGGVLLEEGRAGRLGQPDPDDAVLRDHRVHIPVDRRVGGAEVRLRLDPRRARDQRLVEPQPVGWDARLLLVGRQRGALRAMPRTVGRCGPIVPVNAVGPRDRHDRPRDRQTALVTATTAPRATGREPPIP